MHRQPRRHWARTCARSPSTSWCPPPPTTCSPRPSTSDWCWALTASSVLPLIRTVSSQVRERHINALAALMLTINAVGIASSFLVGDPRLMIAKDSLISSVVGFGIIVSVFRGRPMMTAALEPWLTKGDPARTVAWRRLAGESEPVQAARGPLQPDLGRCPARRMRRPDRRRLHPADRDDGVALGGHDRCFDHARDRGGQHGDGTDGTAAEVLWSGTPGGMHAARTGSGTMTGLTTALKTRGINYDTGFIVAGYDSRPVFDEMVVSRELEIIAKDLHCNAIRISGARPERIETAARFAAEVWVGGLVRAVPDRRRSGRGAGGGAGFRRARRAAASGRRGSGAGRPVVNSACSRAGSCPATRCRSASRP